MDVLLACHRQLEVSGTPAVNTLAWMLSLPLLLVACDDPAPANPGAALPPHSGPPFPAPVSASTPPVSTLGPSSSVAPEKAPLQLLRLTLTSAVKDKEPVDELEAVGPAQRVWAHLAIRNRSSDARRITLIFRVNGEERSTVDLKVEPSWSYRTWGYNTLRASDKSGELTLEVREIGGPLLTTARLPVKASPAPRPAAR
jgi:hypothetical protein